MQIQNSGKRNYLDMELCQGKKFPTGEFRRTKRQIQLTKRDTKEIQVPST